MNKHGFTIVELVVVIGIISILLTIAMLDFARWQRKTQVERYTKELYSDLQSARMRAAFTKRRQSVVLGVQQAVFWSYSSEADAIGTVVSTNNYPIDFTTNGSWATANTIEFDTRGVMRDPIVKVICAVTDVDAAYDALIVSQAMTSFGKVSNRENACARTNVTQK